MALNFRIFVSGRKCLSAKISARTFSSPCFVRLYRQPDRHFWTCIQMIQTSYFRRSRALDHSLSWESPACSRVSCLWLIWLLARNVNSPSWLVDTYFPKQASKSWFVSHSVYIFDQYLPARSGDAWESRMLSDVLFPFVLPFPHLLFVALRHV